ncbi:hypothetical protein B0T10DRAFT_485456 [Thelonectria olida]|uniref:Transmembrane protein n=1 Tax=Thelonectria olida TaxID=1576542 RepID=A0A9P8W602_9HYPO|nr:hypothetical protein B0T10DRAFT_485456 [Thelonectria olida]
MPSTASHQYNTLATTDSEIESSNSINRMQNQAASNQRSMQTVSEATESSHDVSDSFLAHTGTAASTTSRGADPNETTYEPLPQESELGSSDTTRGPTIGWKTSCLLVGFYSIALLVAALHLVMMHSLDGKPTDDNKYLPQPYVTTLSLLLVNVFKASLCGSLATAFTQHMWRILRAKALLVSTIELLHGVRYNPLLLTNLQIIRATPVLYLVALIMWLLSIVVLFPPSALVIVSRGFEMHQPTAVPTFPKVAPFLASWTIRSSAMLYRGSLPGLVHSSRIVLISGKIPVSPSPCGANCSYTVKFEGPNFQCNLTRLNQTVDVIADADAEIVDVDTVRTHYSGGWDPFDRISGLSSILTLNLTYFQGLSYQGRTGILLQETQMLRCLPAWTNYTVSVSYHNGVRQMAYHTAGGGTLLDLYTRDTFGPKMAELQSQNLRVFNLYAVLDSVILSLAGTYPQRVMCASSALEPFNRTLSNGTTLQFNVCTAAWGSTDQEMELNGELQPNQTLLRDTYFNTNIDDLSNGAPSFRITEGLLNEAIANATLHIMLSRFPLSAYNTTATATSTAFHNTYSFQRPLNLVLPYALSLAFSLPFVAIGLVSLRRNGVAALSDSFIQLLVTTARSDRLDHIAAPCSLGGDELALKELARTNIMFGEVSKRYNSDGKVVKRVGFGLQGEVEPLCNGKSFAR